MLKENGSNSTWHYYALGSLAVLWYFGTYTWSFKALAMATRIEMAMSFTCDNASGI